MCLLSSSLRKIGRGKAGPEGEDGVGARRRNRFGQHAGAQLGSGGGGHDGRR